MPLPPLPPPPPHAIQAEGKQPTHSHPPIAIAQVLRVEADDLRMVDSVSSGDVAVAVGLPHAATGDTLVGVASGLRGLKLDGVAVPPPVFSLAVEAESSRQQARKEEMMSWLVVSCCNTCLKPSPR